MYMYVQCMQRCVCVFVGESPQVKEEWFHRVEAFGYEEFADLRYAFSFSTVKASELCSPAQFRLSSYQYPLLNHLMCTYTVSLPICHTAFLEHSSVTLVNSVTQHV